MLQIRFQRCFRFISKQNRTLAVLFRTEQKGQFQIYIRKLQTDQLRYPDTGCIQKLQHRFVPKLLRTRSLHRIHQSFHLFRTQHAGQLLFHPRGFERLRHIHHQHALPHQIMAKRPNRCDIAGNRRSFSLLFFQKTDITI